MDYKSYHRPSTAVTKDEEIPKWGSREQNFVPLVLSLRFSASCVFPKAAEPHFQGQAEH
jgi:hypothetical protein